MHFLNVYFKNIFDHFTQYEIKIVGGLVIDRYASDSCSLDHDMSSIVPKLSKIMYIHRHSKIAAKESNCQWLET